MTNPYAPSQSEGVSNSTTPTNRLLYIWIWLPTAIFGAMLATPADIFSILLAMGFALPCFLAGVVWGSDLTPTRRWILTIACVITAGSLATVTWFSLAPIFLVIASVFAIVNIILGAKSCDAVVHNRCQIFGALSLSYIIGMLLGPIGVIILTVPSLLFANRKTAAGS